MAVLLKSLVANLSRLVLILVLVLGGLGDASGASFSESGLEKVTVKSDGNERQAKAWEALYNTAIGKDIPWLTRASKWLDEGAEFAADGSAKLSKNGQQILEVKNNKILPDKYDIDPSTGKPKAGRNPVGEPANGYQVYKHGDDISVRRVPETGGYDPQDLSKLTGPNAHPNCHVLERHGHDVTDDALIKRAREGIAPDGSVIGNPTRPYKPFSSKFSDPDKLKLAMDKTSPTSAAWSNRQRNRYGGWDVVYDDAGTIFGKGISPPGTGSFEILTKVQASYDEVSPGVFQLVTMFPIK